MESKDDTKEKSKLILIASKLFEKHIKFVVTGVTLVSIVLFSYSAWFYRAFHLEKEVSRAQQNLLLSAESIRTTIINYLKEEMTTISLSGRSRALWVFQT